MFSYKLKWSEYILWQVTIVLSSAVTAALLEGPLKCDMAYRNLYTIQDQCVIYLSRNLLFYSLLFYMLVYYYIQDTGKVEPVSVNVGDKVLVPEYGGTKLSLDEKVTLASIAYMY